MTAQLGISLMLLAIFGMGVRMILAGLAPYRPGPGAVVAVGLVALIGALMFIAAGVWE